MGIVFPTGWEAHTHDEMVTGLFAEEPPLMVDEDGDGILFPSGKTVVYAAPGLFKSYAIQQLCYSAAAQLPWLGYTFPKTLRSVYVACEGTFGQYAQRAKAIHQDIYVGDKFIFIVAGKDKVLSSPKKAQIYHDLCEVYRPDILVIDPIYMVMSGDENKGRDVAAYFNIWDDLIAEYKIHNIQVHHENKVGMTGFTKGKSTLRGHSNLIGWPDSIASIHPVEEGVEMVLRWEKTRRGAPLPDKLFKLEAGRLKGADADPSQVIRQLLKDNGPTLLRDLDNEVKSLCSVDARTVQRERQSLVRAHKIKWDYDNGDHRRRIYSLVEKE